MSPPPDARAPGDAPIRDYGFLSDCQSAALVSRSGAVDWWCVPRFDSPSVFGRLLDPGAGTWTIQPTEARDVTRGYLDDSLVLETVFRTDAGTIAVTDALALEPGARGHDIGHVVPQTLIRRVDGRAGRVPVEVTVAPRFEYGRTVPRWRRAGLGSGGGAGGARPGERWVAQGGPVTLLLDAAAPMTPEGGTLTCAVTVEAGERLEFRLTAVPTYGGGRNPEMSPARGDLEDTALAWRSWQALHEAYDGCHAAQVRRSAMVLQALTYQPSGAVIAAATTSLPEQIGGADNWDYRFAWVRDVSLIMRALWVGACPDEADRFFRWLSRSVGRPGDGPVPILFGVAGERDLSERELDHLRGYRDSRPVRVGNAAWRQRQQDVFGEVLDAAHLLREQIAAFDEELQELLVALADRAAQEWRRPDAGMWEAREGERRYLSSALMCWVALDRAVALADRLGPDADRDGWRAAREEIRAAIVDEGWHEQAGAYTGAFGSDSLDASVLLMPLVGFLPADDPRMRQTVAAIRERLGEGALLRRWSGDTHGFLICSYWLVECLALAGEVDEARRLFDELAGYPNDLGLLAEEADRDTGELLGNFPQAFSHVGLINAAWALTRAPGERPC